MPKQTKSRTIGYGNASRRFREPLVCHPIELPNAKAAPLQGAGRRSHYSKFAPVRVQRLLTRIPQNCTKVTRGSG